MTLTLWKAKELRHVIHRSLRADRPGDPSDAEALGYRWSARTSSRGRVQRLPLLRSSQLERLHRIVALRQLGFGLDDISSILDRGVDANRISALLRIRRAEVEQEHRIAADRLVDVERRLQLIEKENHMSQIEIVEKSLPAVRLAAHRVVVADQPSVASVVGPAFDAVAEIIGDECGGSGDADRTVRDD